MFIVPGIISGKRSIPTPDYINYMNLTSLTVRPMLGWSLNLNNQNAEYDVSTTSTKIHTSPTVTVPSITGDKVIISVSMDVFNSNTETHNLYAVNDLSSGYVDVTSRAYPSNKVAVSYKYLPAVGSEYVDYIHSKTGAHDSVTWAGVYNVNAGGVQVIGSSTAYPQQTGSMVIGIHHQTLIGDNLFIFAVHRNFIQTPTGFSIDFTRKVLGTNSQTEDGAKNQTLTIFRKVITQSDIDVGYVIVTTIGATPTTDINLLPKTILTPTTEISTYG